MSSLPNCPKCNSEYTYEHGFLVVCPECFHEWNPELETEKAEEKAQEKKEEKTIKDAHGTVLKDGDSVIVIKDLKVKGSSNPIKKGTKVNNIQLKEGNHDIDCRVDGFGDMELKSEFVKKA